MAQGEICRGSVIAFAFFPLAILDGVVWVWAQWLVFAGRVEDEIRPQWVEQGSTQLVASKVGKVDQGTTWESPV